VLGNAVHTINPDGTGLARLGAADVFDQDPAWSPAHDRIAFGRSANIHVMQADGSDLRQLTSSGLDKAPTWSPDGQRIAFSRQGGSGAGIWVMNADGSAQRPLATVPGVAWRLSWSPDGTEIAFSTYSGPGVWTVDVHDGRLGLLDENGFSPSWGPRGRIAFSAESSAYNGDIFTMNRNGNGVTSLPGGSSPQIDANPVWSADGSRIAFVSSRDGDWAIFTMNARGTDVVRVTAGDTPSW
jgi:TolB protein